MVISTYELGVGYGKGKEQQMVLSGLNLSLKKGKLTALIGINGSGKSTLLRTLTGIQQPLAGRVELAGKNLHEMSAVHIARQISLVLTDRIEASNLSVYELIALGRHPHTNWTAHLTSIDHQKIETALSLTHISDLANRRIGELSDGQMQKVMIARALAQDGALMVLDEPTAHLDLVSRTEIMLLLRRIAIGQQKAILVSTHDLELALQTAHCFWMIEKRANVPSFVHCGIPEDLVLNGTFEKTFNTGQVFFDRSDGTFKIQTATEKTRLRLMASDHTSEIYYWTKRLLEKSGYQCVNNDYRLSIHILPQSPAKWIINDRVPVDSLAKLLQLIENEGL